MGSIDSHSIEHTLRNTRGDFVHWHRGRPHYVLWALQLQGTGLAPRVHAAQRHLARWLLDGYRRQPHITLGLCGFPSALPTLDDDFGAATLRAQLDALRRQAPEPFDLEVGDLDSFSSVPYLRVQADPTRLHALRQCLANNTAINTPMADYVPHVTVGLYGDAWPMAELRAAFARIALDTPLSMRVSGLQLLAYSAREIGGPLTTLADYGFSDGSLLWHAGAELLPAAFTSLG